MADILEFSSLSILGLLSLAKFLTVDCSVWSDCSEILNFIRFRIGTLEAAQFNFIHLA